MQPKLIVDPDEDVREDLLPDPIGEELFDYGVEPDREPGRGKRLLAALYGPLIAAAAFVPTFVLVIVGVPYLLGGTTPADKPGRPDRAAPALVTAPDTPTASGPSEPIRDPFAPAPPALPETGRGAPQEVDRLGEPRQEPERPAEDAAGPVEQPGADQAALPPPRPAPAIETPPKAAAERGEGSGRWTRAAAFTDRRAAARLADSIREQGYPVDIREDRSAPRPWVVWIGARPRAGAGRRP
jgi:hypothetical protein